MSKVLRTYASIDVVEAARRRIRNVFSNGCKVYLSFSGGKDSLCLAHLVLHEITTGAIDPTRLTVVYVDEEGMYSDIIEIVHHWRKRFMTVSASFEWLCLEFKHFSCLNALTSDESFILWDRTRADAWIRTPPPFAIMWDGRLKVGQETYQQFLARTHVDGINIDGVRMAESYQRVKYMSRSMTHRLTPAGQGGISSGNRISPLYDWKDSDVWQYLLEQRVTIPMSYLYMWQIGVAKNRLRISQFFSVDTIGNLYGMSQFYPDLLDRVTRREENAYLAILYYDTEMFRRNTQSRRELEKDEAPKDYRALLTEAFRNIERDYPTPHARKIAMDYRGAYLNFGSRMTANHLKRFYEALKAGDPKGRSLRGLIAVVKANDLKEAQEA